MLEPLTMQAADFYASTGALALAMLALLHGMVWHRQRQRWALVFALCMALSALYFLFDPWLRPVGDQANVAGSLLGAMMILGLLVAMVDYVGLPTRVARWLLAAAVGLGLLLLALRLSGLMPRSGGFLSYALYFVVLAGLAAWGMQREPGRGHGLVLLALLSYPAAVASALLGHLPVELVRYVIVVPTVMLGMTVLTTGQLRERAAAEQEVQRRRDAEADLRRLNDSLEQRVAERTAELQAMVAALESFNRNVSHDLRGPLGGMAQALRLTRQALDAGDLPRVEHMLTLVTQQAESSAELVNALLTLARAGSVALQPGPVDLGTVVAESLAQLRAARGNDEAALPVTVQPLPSVTADPGLLRQALVNLLGNALKFSAQAEPPRVEVGASQQDGRTVVWVRDNGVGFAADRAQRLFQPFQRLHGGQFQGSGVGLSIVKRIIDRHGGRVWADSIPGRGATFFFTLD